MAAIRYFVADLDRAIEFYSGNLGFEVEERWGPAFAIVRSPEGHELWLSGPGTSAALPMPDGSQPIPGGWNRIVVTASDFDTQLAKLHESGVAFRGEPIVGPGGRQVLLEDPDGNPIELFDPRPAS